MRAAAAAAAAVIAAEVTEAKAAAASEAHLRMPSTSVDAMPASGLIVARCAGGVGVEVSGPRGRESLLTREKTQQ